MRKITLALLGIVAIGAVAAVVYVYSNRIPANNAAPNSSVTAAQSPVLQLQQTNQDFKAGESYQSYGNYTEAITSYQKALAETQDPALDAAIEYYLAYSYESKGDYTDAIQTFKLLASNNPNWPVMEAYAVQSLASMHYNNPNDQSITADIFKDAPYNSFGPSSTTTVSRAYWNLFAHAASLYPLGISETWIALGYENTLRIKLGAATTSPQGIRDIALINNSISKANADLVRIANDPIADTEELDVPGILSREGLVEGYMAQMGVGSPVTAEQSFKDAIQSANQQKFPAGNEDAFYYAAFLATYYGEKRAADIDMLLAPFTASNTNTPAITPPMASTLADIRTDPSEVTTRGWAVALGKIDPSFKAYLISLGWQSSDFSG